MVYQMPSRSSPNSQKQDSRAQKQRESQQQVRAAILAKMEREFVQVAAAADLKRVRAEALRLFNVSSELTKLAREPQGLAARAKAKKLISTGRTALAVLMEEFRTTGLLDRLEEWIQSAGALGLSPRDLSAEESALLRRLGMRPRERRVLHRIFSTIRKAKQVSFEQVFKEANELFGVLDDELPRTIGKEASRCWGRNLGGVVKFFGGVGLIAIDVTAYFGSGGIVMPIAQALVSVITGVCMSIDGVANLGRSKERKD